LISYSLRPLFFALLSLASLTGRAQSTLTGIVTDKQTGEPVPFANIFFAYTTQGTATLVDGTFEIKNIPDGSYDLLVEMIGYRRHKQPLEFLDGQYKIEVALEQETILLDTVAVMADQSDKRFYPLFVRFFIGEGVNAKQCEILNRDALHFIYDKEKNSLSVSARRPIVVNNPRLGYKVYYTLDRFELDFKTGSKILEGSPRFEDLPFRKRRDSLSRAKKRDVAYRGSLFHLTRSLYENTTSREGFSFFEADSSRGPEAQPPHKELRRLKPEELINGEGVKKLAFKGLLKVEYKASEDTGYPARVRAQPVFERSNPKGRQQTYIKLSSRSLDIYENGYYADPRSIYLVGYLVWRETVCNMVPIGWAVSR
jgi:hypothetical protein